MVQVEGSLFKDINDAVLVDISDDDFAIAITYDHNVRVKRMAVHRPNRRQFDGFAHLPGYFHLHGIVYQNFPIAPVFTLVSFLLLFKRACQMGQTGVPASEIAIVHFLLALGFVLGNLQLLYHQWPLFWLI